MARHHRAPRDANDGGDVFCFAAFLACLIGLFALALHGCG